MHFNSHQENSAGSKLCICQLTDCFYRNGRASNKTSRTCPSMTVKTRTANLQQTFCRGLEHSGFVERSTTSLIDNWFSLLTDVRKSITTANQSSNKQYACSVARRRWGIQVLCLPPAAPCRRMRVDLSLTKHVWVSLSCGTSAATPQVVSEYHRWSFTSSSNKHCTNTDY